MILDPKICQAIKEAAQRAGQTDQLAEKIIAWMNAIVAGNEKLTDTEMVQRHLELLYDETEVGAVAGSEP